VGRCLCSINKAVRDLKPAKARFDRAIEVLESVQKEHLAYNARPALPAEGSGLSHRMEKLWVDRREKKPGQRSSTGCRLERGGGGARFLRAKIDLISLRVLVARRAGVPPIAGRTVERVPLTEVTSCFPILNTHRLLEPQVAGLGARRPVVVTRAGGIHSVSRLQGFSP
jgi:hypothetical protein